MRVKGNFKGVGDHIQGADGLAEGSPVEIEARQLCRHALVDRCVDAIGLVNLLDQLAGVGLQMKAADSRCRLKRRRLGGFTGRFFVERAGAAQERVVRDPGEVRSDFGVVWIEFPCMTKRGQGRGAVAGGLRLRRSLNQRGDSMAARNLDGARVI